MDLILRLGNVIFMLIDIECEDGKEYPPRSFEPIRRSVTVKGMREKLHSLAAAT